METKILVTGSTFFSQVKADLCNNLHSLIIIFFFFSQGRFFGGGWYQRKGGGRMLVRFRREVYVPSKGCSDALLPMI